MGTALFWVITQRVAVIPYRRFGTTYRSHLQGQESKKKARFLLGFLTLKLEEIGRSETSVRNYRYSLRNNPEEHSSQPNHVHRIRFPAAVPADVGFVRFNSAVFMDAIKGRPVFSLAK